MNSRNDLLFVSIHGAFMTFDPLSCTSNMKQDKEWMNKNANRRSANTGWVRRANPNMDQPSSHSREGCDRSNPSEREAPSSQAAKRHRMPKGHARKPRKVSDLASFLSALVLFGPNMTHMTH